MFAGHGEENLTGTAMELYLWLMPMAFLAALIVAWFHGEKGVQKIQPRELWMLGALGVAAIVVTTMVLM